MKLEIIATCIEDALAAEEGGADRLELITAITEGGLTPGIGLVRQVARAVSIPVNVMVRPHSRSFIYSAHDLDTMAYELDALADSGAAGAVLGAITADGRVDERALERLLPHVGALEVTFHRAFDELEDQAAALAILNRYPQIKRVLTSAGPRPALESARAMRALVDASGKGHVLILAGSGLRLEGIEDFVRQTKVPEVHFGSAVRYGGQALSPVDPAAVRALAKVLQEEEKGEK